MDIYKTTMKGFTLFELLIVLLILSVSTLMVLPIWDKNHEKFILEKEQKQLYLFFRYVQSRVENSGNVWLLIVNRDLINKKWCISAQIRHEKVCDCLQPSFCEKDLMVNIYLPLFPQKTMIISKNYFPNEVVRFSGVRNTIQSDCFLLQSGQERVLFSFFNVGSIKVKDTSSLSACGDH